MFPGPPTLLSSSSYLKPVAVRAVLSLFAFPETQIPTGQSPEEAAPVSSPSLELLRGRMVGWLLQHPPILFFRQEGPLCINAHTLRQDQLHNLFKNY